MKNFLLTVCFIVLYLIICISVIAQQELPERYRPSGPQPEVNKSLPNYTFENVTYYQSKSVSLSDFKGKWLLLDFWFVNCASCISSFPKINKIQKEFKHTLNYLLVGINEEQKFGGKDIEKLYEGMRDRQNLELISAYDSILNFRWGIWSMPHIIIVDPNGIVKYITSGSDMTVEKIREMIEGKDVKFKEKDPMRPEYDVTTFPGSADNKLVYRSILTRSNGETPVGNNFFRFARWSEEGRKHGFYITSVSLKKLYYLAYSGKADWEPGDSLHHMPLHSEVVCEAKDSAMFDSDPDLTPPDFKGLYSYNLAVPADKSKNPGFMMNVLQKDLQTSFGFKVNVEKRKMQVWELVISDIKKAGMLKTKGRDEYIGDGTESFAFPSGFTARNIPLKTIFFNITYYIGGQDCSWFYDATGITHNIDIELKAVMTDFNDIQKALRKNGLEFRKALKEFNVIVVKD